MYKRAVGCVILLLIGFFTIESATVYADGDLHKLGHILIVMQENHSFDNYFGALAYDPKSPYHNGDGACEEDDHSCVDGLTCISMGASLVCSNSNPDANEQPVAAFHDPRRCVKPDLDHEWVGSHYEANFGAPNDSLTNPLNNGFVNQNDTSSFGQGEPTGMDYDDTMGFYTQDDLPFYYDLAERFAIDDRYFNPVLAPTFPNRSYLMAATSFGHLSGAEVVAGFSNPTTPIPYKPITGTLFGLLDRFGVSWTDYYSDVPEAFSFVDTSELGTNAKTIDKFFADAQAGNLPQVAFVESATGNNPFNKLPETDEHPPTDIQRGQAFVSKVVNAVRYGPHGTDGPSWKDSIIFIVYDENGGFYDHVAPAAARQGGALTPDGIGPGQCADLSNPPASKELGGGANCSESQADAKSLCPQATSNQSFPADCATFNQLGFRVPLIAVSPFSKPHYVSHTVGDHTSIIALIEKRFIRLTHEDPEKPFLTRRDRHAATLEDLFDFNHSPSLNSAVTQASAPATDCTPAGL